MWCVSLPLPFTLEGLSPNTLHIGSLGTMTAADDRIFSLRGHRLRLSSKRSTPLQICHFTCHFPHTRHKRRRASSIDPLQIREHHRPARTLFNNINNILGSGFTLEHALSGRLRARYMLLSEPSFPTFECVVDSCQTGDVLLPCL